MDNLKSLPVLENATQSEPPMAAQHLPWTAPRLVRFGSVAEITQGIAYRPLDGISNLT